MTNAPKPALIFARYPTAVLVLADGSTFYGEGCGAFGEAVGEVCFNTAMSGYQEIMTDPSYAGQIISFTAPHIGNVGTNARDNEATSLPAKRAAVGAIMRGHITSPSNWRSEQALGAWMADNNIIGLSGIDTRALTRKIREDGMPHGVIAHASDGVFDVTALAAKAAAWAGLEGLDMAKDVSCKTTHCYDGRRWSWSGPDETESPAGFHVVVIDFGVKDNILRSLASVGAKVTVVPASTSFADIEKIKPDGVLLSNGPGDPAATGANAVETIQKIIRADIPVFGICLGHQMLGLALGAKTVKMAQGHHGANHPVKDLSTGKVEIVSMNHGFAVDSATLPKTVVETHVSLFDGSNCGIALVGKRVFSVQYHPEANPGPQDSFYLFERFAASIKARTAKVA